MTVTNFSSISNSGRFDLKVDKLLNPTEGNLVKQDSEGNLVDTGVSINAVSKSRVFWGYQDFSAGAIATQNVTLTELSGYPDIPFDSSNIINAAFIVRSDDLEEYAYTGLTKLFSSKVKVNSISGTAVTLSGVPHSSYAIRIYFQYTYASYPINYTAPTAILSASALHKLDDIIATQEELATKFDAALTNNYDAIVTNNPYVTGGVPNTAALSITTSSSDTVQKLFQILYMIYQSGIWKYHTSSTSIKSLDTQFSDIQAYHENADNLSTGTIPNARLSSHVTQQGNTFNGNSQLVQTDSTGKLPAIDGSLLTNLPIGGGNFSHNSTIATFDLNTKKTTGGYAFNQASGNMPSSWPLGASFGVLLAYECGTNNGIQIVFSADRDSSTQYNLAFYRCWESSAFTTWSNML